MYILTSIKRFPYNTPLFSSSCITYTSTWCFYAFMASTTLPMLMTSTSSSLALISIPIANLCIQLTQTCHVHALQGCQTQHIPNWTHFFVFFPSRMDATIFPVARAITLTSCRLRRRLPYVLSRLTPKCDLDGNAVFSPLTYVWIVVWHFYNWAPPLLPTPTHSSTLWPKRSSQTKDQLISLSTKKFFDGVLLHFGLNGNAFRWLVSPCVIWFLLTLSFSPPKHLGGLSYSSSNTSGFLLPS